MAHAPEPMPAQPYRSPSYPQRVHIRERAHWQQVLADCEARLQRARAEWESMPPGPARDARQDLLARLSGARDQVADAARRMPMEVGDLYAEDRHRLEEAVAAMERTLARW